MKKIIYTLFIFPLFMFAQELSVASGGTLTISTTGSMTVTSTINVNSNGNLIIETSRTNSGSLIAKSAGANQRPNCFGRLFKKNPRADNRIL